MRTQMIARAVFYVLTLMAAVLAVLASVVGGRSAGVIMTVSWYLIAAGVMAFVLMLILNVVLRDDEARHEPATRQENSGLD